MFANVNKLFDEDPQAAYAVLDGFSQAVSNGYVGDLRGRRYAVGFRFDF